MKILFIGDIVARSGREAVSAILPQLKAENDYELVIANAENLTHGKGASAQHIQDMMKAGVDFFTAGNHIWRHKSLLMKMGDPNFPLVRPANYPPSVPGQGWQIIETKNKKRVLITNLMGRVFMGIDTDCPFRKIDEIVNITAEEKLHAVIIDFHAEATSEKMAFGYFVDGKVSAVFGTHTHVPTADGRILEGGTAYISDAGMVGKKDSVIGVDKEGILKHFMTQLPSVHEFTPGSAIFNGVEVEIDPDSKKALSIKSVYREC
ncbi:TIGR00282 family metallophosphoesterase [Candidatus Peregrinibacteria bacterium]|nr:TIGR00282 family metallophosphoesterase [Candidatus Peregrinibacteria bacterium]